MTKRVPYLCKERGLFKKAGHFGSLVRARNRLLQAKLCVSDSMLIVCPSRAICYNIKFIKELTLNQSLWGRGNTTAAGKYNLIRWTRILTVFLLIVVTVTWLFVDLEDLNIRSGWLVSDDSCPYQFGCVSLCGWADLNSCPS